MVRPPDTSATTLRACFKRLALATLGLPFAYVNLAAAAVYLVSYWRVVRALVPQAISTGNKHLKRFVTASILYLVLVTVPPCILAVGSLWIPWFALGIIHFMAGLLSYYPVLIPYFACILLARATAWHAMHHVARTIAGRNPEENDMVMACEWMKWSTLLLALPVVIPLYIGDIIFGIGWLVSVAGFAVLAGSVPAPAHLGSHEPPAGTGPARG